MRKKTNIEQELIEGLQEVLEHRRGSKRLQGRVRGLPAPPHSWNSRKIKHLREDILQLSQTEFAILLNVKAPTIRAWEQGHNVPSGAAARLLQIFERDQSVVQKLAV